MLFLFVFVRVIQRCAAANREIAHMMLGSLVFYKSIEQCQILYCTIKTVLICLYVATKVTLYINITIYIIAST